MDNDQDSLFEGKTAKVEIRYRVWNMAKEQDSMQKIGELSWCVAYHDKIRGGKGLVLCDSESKNPVSPNFPD
jgi:hypothetical protein